jgi:hypothetical protein
MRELPSRKPALRLGPLYNFRCSTVRLVHLASEPLDEFLAAPGYRRGANYFVKLEDLNYNYEYAGGAVRARFSQPPHSATAQRDRDPDFRTQESAFPRPGAQAAQDRTASARADRLSRSARRLLLHRQSDARAQLWLNQCVSSSEAGVSDHKD